MRFRCYTYTDLQNTGKKRNRGLDSDEESSIPCLCLSLYFNTLHCKKQSRRRSDCFRTDAVIEDEAVENSPHKAARSDEEAKSARGLVSVVDV